MKPSIKTLLPLLVCQVVWLTAWLGQDRPPRQVRLGSSAPSVRSSLQDLVKVFDGWREHSVEVVAAGERLYVQRVQQREERLRAAADPLPVLERMILSYNGTLSAGTTRRLARAVVRSARANRVDPFLVAALISKESRFRPYAVSPGGAVGLGQLLPATARSLGVDCYQPEQNIEGCARYLGRQMRRWESRADAVALALASYNAGPGAVQKFQGVPPYRVTRDYVRVIEGRYARLRDQAARRRRLALRTLGSEG